MEEENIHGYAKTDGGHQKGDLGSKQVAEQTQLLTWVSCWNTIGFSMAMILLKFGLC